MIGIIYRHPKGNVNEFTNKLESTLTKIASDSKIKDCIIAGDINIDPIKFENQTVVKDYLSTMLRNAVMPTIILPTRVTSHTCTLIDHIFYYSKTHRNNIFSENLFLDITYHFANFLILGQKRHEKSYVRIFGDKNRDKFKDSLQSINFATKTQINLCLTFMSSSHKHITNLSLS